MVLKEIRRRLGDLIPTSVLAKIVAAIAATWGVMFMSIPSGTFISGLFALLLCCFPFGPVPLAHRFFVWAPEFARQHAESGRTTALRAQDDPVRCVEVHLNDLLGAASILFWGCWIGTKLKTFPPRQTW